MKKNLLLIAAMAATMSAGAQSVYNFMDVAALGIAADLTDQVAGFVLVDKPEGKMTLAFDEPLKVFNPTGGDYNYIALGSDELVQNVQGVTGNNNPKGMAVNVLPASGCVYKIATDKTGYYTIPGKLNSNKNYWVFEGESTAAYRAVVVLPDAPKGAYTDATGAFIGKKLEVTLPHDEYDALDLTAADAAQYFAGEPGAFTATKKLSLMSGSEVEDLGEGSGALQVVSVATPDFPSTFTVFAQGSKLCTNGYIYTPSENPSFAAAPQIVFGGVDKVVDGTTVPAPAKVVFGEAGAGIEDVVVAPVVVDENAPVYNIYGQRVSKDTKGLLIQNGVKFYNR